MDDKTVCRVCRSSESGLRLPLMAVTTAVRDHVLGWAAKRCQKRKPQHGCRYRSRTQNKRVVLLNADQQ